MAEWRVVSQCDNYSVSNLGDVKNNKSERILKGTVNTRGYLIYALSKNGEAKTFNGHTLVLENFIPKPENKMEINHINGIKDDNRLENLEWVTHSENLHHAYQTGLNPKSKTVLITNVRTNEQTKYHSAREAGRELGMDGSYISRLCRQNKTVNDLSFTYVGGAL